MSYRLALGGLGLTAVAVLAASGCRAGRPDALYDGGLAHRGAHRVPGGQGYRLGTPAPQAVSPAAGATPQAAPAPVRATPRVAAPAVRVVPPGLRHLPALRPRRDLGPAGPPVHACSTVSLGPGRGSSVQCVQRSDEVITKSDSRTIRDGWPDGDWGDRDRDHGGRELPDLHLGRGWPDLGLGRND